MTEPLVGTGPQAEAFAGASPARVAKRLLLATRPGFLSASVLPVLLGTAWGYRAAGGFDAGVFVLALAAVVAVHAGANVLNDVFDETGGSDRLNADFIHPYTGGSRFIQAGIMSLGAMARWGAALMAAGAALGLALAWMKGAGVLLFGLAGLGLGLLYSAPPLQLSARGLGEAAIAVAFGVLPVAGAAWLQGAALDGRVVLISLPLAVWTAAIIVVNEVPDIGADAAAGKRTLAVRLGAQGARRLWFALQAAGFAAVAAAAASGLLPWPGAVVPALMLALALRAGRGIDAAPAARPALVRAIRTTLAVQAAGGLWLAAWLWLG